MLLGWKPPHGRSPARCLRTLEHRRLRGTRRSFPTLVCLDCSGCLGPRARPSAPASRNWTGGRSR